MQLKQFPLILFTIFFFCFLFCLLIIIFRQVCFKKNKIKLSYFHPTIRSIIVQFNSVGS